jgi:riboflavin kinase / FMN adenylyltransferase
MILPNSSSKTICFTIFAEKRVEMQIHYGYENLRFRNPVVTTGIFDGVHKGHRALLDFLVSRAKALKGESVVLTFSPHPRIVLEQNPEKLSFLTTLEEKKILLEKANIDHLVIIEFNKVFSNIRACDFVKDVLNEKIGTKHLIIGYNHHFGRKGEGDFNTIKQCAESLDFIVEQVPGFKTEKVTISSSEIRKALLSGKLDEANKWLGYNYSVSGSIIKGRQIGRSLGFPTANIEPDDAHKLTPAIGVYAVEVQINSKVYAGMLSIGTNPTVNDDASLRSIEVYILDFNEDIYGKTITVVFRKRLRDEIKFESTAQLSKQMKLDKEQTLQLLG